MAEEKSRILIVDDIEENLRVLTETLTEEGFYPLQAKSGERAIAIAKKAQPDLILLDIKMPGMDGYETIDRLKSDPDTAPIPVIFISALNQIEDKVRGFTAGAVDYVSKPFQKEEVIARVGTHLSLRQALRNVEIEREKSEKLLLNILPESVARELKDTGVSKPQRFDNVTFFFSDFVGFTGMSAEVEPEELIEQLNELFTEFDNIMERNNCERIKTIGDAYLAVCGIPEADSRHGENIIKASQEIISYLDSYRQETGRQWRVRIGIHSGNAVGAIVGTKKYIYDVFGDSVNTASRMESNSEPGRINISETTYELVKDRFDFEEREPIMVKGKGSMNMFFLK
ncbi:adenylate/guanylate cyclase domain-containing protein [Spirochaeta isovalerica]|uniref:Class 3 adenylate cyclase n=1 Tax=Spirochaeta isovalerica TaxID=150 RepID=A0A841RDM0_9SPIO|nr:adenylate/guanylate cyclase domain-containing protein [Spirochaeta isovalerica]MBB6481726.1 class 3 adenylate cyclase [Spirochaeta isovalerica]